MFENRTHFLETKIVLLARIIPMTCTATLELGRIRFEHDFKELNRAEIIMIYPVRHTASHKKS